MPSVLFLVYLADALHQEGTDRDGCKARAVTASAGNKPDLQRRVESIAKCISVLQDESMSYPDFTRRLVFRSALLCFALLAALATVSGKSAKMISSWFNPNYEGKTFKKILVIGVAQNL